ncbi:MAG: tol-pal system protein YbgF [Gammaproteobacteria bacterium]
MQKKMISIFILILSLSLSVVTVAWADAPVVNLDQMSDSSSDSSPATNDQAIALPMQPPLPMPQRVKQLEQQMTNMTQMNLPAKLDDLHQQIQQLQGQVEEQAHTIKTLQDQLSKFYQDVNQRLTPTKDASAANSSDTANNAGNSTVTIKTANTSEQAAYQKALNLLMNKKYDPAATAFQAYLKQYPNGQFAVNANYWLGEIYFLQNKFTQAGPAFELVISKAPHDPKIPDAKLKLALIHDQVGQHDQARKELQQIIQHYPGSSAAQLAKLRLKAMSTTTNSTNTGVEP